MKIFAIVLWILQAFRGATGFFSTVECPPYYQTDILQLHEFNFQPLDCTLLMSCKDPSNNDFDSHIESCSEEKNLSDDDFLFDCFTENPHTCSMKLKVTMIRNLDLESSLENPCPSSKDSLRPSLSPVPGNCSLFYKCDWGSAILFECPPELHFNADLQVCDWPWQARCDSSWNGCPRPYPRCPANYPRPLYLPHPHVCDKFYQCNWGTSHLQTCPTGLHFNSALKICDWPYRANCQTC